MLHEIIHFLNGLADIRPFGGLEPHGLGRVALGPSCECLRMFKAASVFLIAAVMAQAASSQERQATPPASDRTAPNARGDADANANAPVAPALDQEPHGSGTVFQELDALRNENRSKDSGR